MPVDPNGHKAVAGGVVEQLRTGHGELHQYRRLARVVVLGTSGLSGERSERLVKLAKRHLRRRLKLGAQANERPRGRLP